MDHTPTSIALHARELLASHGEHAESVAESRMVEQMQVQDVASAAFWMAVIHELRQLRTGGVN